LDETEGRILGRQLMEAAEAAYLTTIDEKGFPHTRAMFNLRNSSHFPPLRGLFAEHKNDFLVLFTTNTSSVKIGQIENNPSSCVYYCIPMEFRGLMLAGNVRIVDDPDLKERIWQEGWERYYPEGRKDPDYAVLSMYPDRAEYYHRLDGVNFDFEERSD
jgi:general stress protein 26